MPETIAFTLNRKPVRLKVDRRRALLSVLLEDLGQTDTEFGCGQGRCGACTVLLDQRAVRSCQVRMNEVQGREVVTWNGVAARAGFRRLRHAFAEHEAVQCAYRTNGVLLAAHALLLEHPHPTRDQILQGLRASLCGCGTRACVVSAIRAAAGPAPQPSRPTAASTHRRKLNP